MVGTPGSIATVHVWQVPARAVGPALVAMATDHRRIRRLPGLRFAKLLGTGRGATFMPTDAMLTRWMLVASWVDADAARQAERADVLAAWHRRATQVWHATLRPLSARGRWSGQVPFAAPEGQAWDGPLAVLTRARLSARHAGTFWRAVPPVVDDLRERPGLITAFGFGEAPVGVQGTFSLWRDNDAVRRFAYSGSAHRAVVQQTPVVGWYAESLFARFAVLDSAGTLDGQAPLAAA